MTQPVANCPNCGAKIVFLWSSSVQTVCEYCKSILVRTDVDLKKVGQVADLPPDSSPIQINTEGKYGNKANYPAEDRPPGRLFSGPHPCGQGCSCNIHKQSARCWTREKRFWRRNSGSWQQAGSSGAIQHAGGKGLRLNHWRPASIWIRRASVGGGLKRNPHRRIAGEPFRNPTQPAEHNKRD